MKTYTSPSVAESSAELTKEEHVSLDDIMHEATLIGAAMTEESTVSREFSQPAPVELPFRPSVPSSLVPAALATAAHSSEWDEQDEDGDDEDEFAINFAMGLPIFNTRATDIAELLGAYDPLDDEYDDDERFGEPLEGFHAEFYKLAGLDADGEEISTSESVDSSGDEFDSDEDEEEDEDESDYGSESGDEEVDRASLIGDDDETEEWEEQEYSDAELDAEEGVSASSDEESEETELDDEDERERKRKGLQHN